MGPRLAGKLMIRIGLLLLLLLPYRKCLIRVERLLATFSDRVMIYDELLDGPLKVIAFGPCLQGLSTGFTLLTRSELIFASVLYLVCMSALLLEPLQ
jgi:hypothetical protein